MRERDAHREREAKRDGKRERLKGGGTAMTHHNEEEQQQENVSGQHGDERNHGKKEECLIHLWDQVIL